MMVKFYINHKRTDIYKIYIDKLLENGNAYKCYMSKDELDALRAAQEAAKKIQDMMELGDQKMEKLLQIPKVLNQ